MLRSREMLLKSSINTGLQTQADGKSGPFDPNEPFQGGGCTQTCRNLWKCTRTRSCAQPEAMKKKKKSNYRGNARPSVKVRQLSWGSSIGFLADSSGWTCKTGRKVFCTHPKMSSWKTATNSKRGNQLPFAKTNPFSWRLFFRTWWTFFLRPVA